MSRPGGPQLTLGSGLGELTNELRAKYGEEAYIIDFTSGGPKNYSYRVKNPVTGKISEVVKVKGITLNHATSQVVNFDSIFECVQKELEPQERMVMNKYFARSYGGDITVTSRKKIYKPVINKRRRIGDRTYPYGYRGPIFN